MRLPTFSFLKSCKLNLLVPHIAKRYISENVETKSAPNTDIVANSEFLEVHSTWPETVEPELRAGVLRSMRVLPDFVTKEEEEEFMKELNPYLMKMRYEFDHWDNAIQGYRETERSAWAAAAAAALARVRSAAVPRALPYAHVLDLAPSGHIKPHVDAVRFCGDVIAGLCLLSPAVMRLAVPGRPALAVDALLPRRCLYIMSGRARYDMEHSVPGGEASSFRGAAVTRTRRVSVIQRAPPDAAAAATDDRYRRE